MSYNNQTNGILDLEKESVIVGDIVVDALMYPQLVSHEDSDRASEITIQKFLEFRRKQASANSINTNDTKMESDSLATIIISALINVGIINAENRLQAIEIASEEILVRRSMEQL